MSKKVKIIILIATIVLLAIGGTFAWYAWTSGSEDETLISTDVGAYVINFNGGPSLAGRNLKPVNDKTLGISKKISIKSNTTNELYFDMYLDIVSLDEGLKDISFRYELYNDTTNSVETSGNFSSEYLSNNLVSCSTNDTNHLVLLSNKNVYNTVTNYTLYIWIDGANYTNPNTMMNQSFNFILHASGENAIRKENVLIYDSSLVENGGSTFLNTPIKRNEIKTISFLNTNVPSGDYIDIYDVSEDKSIKLWYTNSDTTGLYNVYIGSSDGVVTLPEDSSKLFAVLTNCTNINFEYVDTSKVINMTSMFTSCSSLTELDLSNFNTSNVTTMLNMFSSCSSLTSLDLSNFDTTNVEDMAAMFGGCSSIKSLDLSSFDTSNVTLMTQMFYGCSGLINLNLSNFNTSSVTEMNQMFRGCKKLLNLDLSNFDTSNVTLMAQMFYDCSGLINLNLSSFDTRLVTEMNGMFRNCTSLVNLDLSSFDFNNVTTYGSILRSVSTSIPIVVKDSTQKNILKNTFGNTSYNILTVDEYNSL